MIQSFKVQAMDIPQSENIFNITTESLKFLKIFQTLGFLPFKLNTNEGNFGRNASICLFIFLISFVLLRCFLLPDEKQFIVLFFLDIITLFADQILTQFMKKTQIKLFKMIGEIDQKIEMELRMKHKLEALNIRLHQKFKIKWLLYSAGSMYYPIKHLIFDNFSMKFFDAIFRIISW
ncbi:hypothetical protein ACKWTF_008343 [Chironomus riparius]